MTTVTDLTPWLLHTWTITGSIVVAGLAAFICVIAALIWALNN